MQVAPGTRISHYEIVASIGRGGMGEVWRAKDTRLGRDVAIKVLPEEFSRDVDRLARFEREARVLASLNHPNIAAIYGLDEADGTRFLAMELAEGEDLSARLRHGAVPLDEAVAIAVQIADALEAAHEKGIIHRDLKPANVKLSDDGRVKLLDFGLAKALEPDESDPELSNSPTMVRAATHAGLILGTAAYMSPEQARGKSVDRRADIWSFGVVLYEMLTGTRLFAGETVSDTLAAVLTREPSWETIPPGVPPHVRRLLARCLDRNPKSRLRDIGEARVALEGADATVADLVRSAAPPSRVLLAAALACVALAATLAYFLGRRGESPAEPAPGEIRFDLPVYQGIDITGYDSASVVYDISPDGRALVASIDGPDGQKVLAYRRLDSTDVRVLQATEGAVNPFFSHDGREVAFEAGRQLRRVAIAGGGARVICSLETALRGGAWLADGTIVFGQWKRGLLRVSANGGAPAEITRPAKERSHLYPVALPDGSHVLYSDRSSFEARLGDRSIMIAPLDGGEPKTLFANDYFVGYLNPGWILYVDGSQLLAKRLRLDPPVVEGDAVVVAGGISAIAGPGVAGFDTSPAGTIAFRRRMEQPETQLSWFDRSGRKLAGVGGPSRDVSVRLSPDGTLAVVSQAGDSASARELEVPANMWVVDLGRGLRTRVSFDPGTSDENAVWSPDGSRLAYASHRDHGPPALCERPSSGGGSEVVHPLTTDLRPHPFDWSPDGESILFQSSGDAGEQPNLDLRVWRMVSKTVEPFAVTRFNESHGQFSPDGRFVVYCSDDSGRKEVYVRPFPTGDERWQISVDGGGSPRWRRDGKEIVYLSLAGRMMSVALTAGSPFRASAPTELFDAKVPPTEFNYYGGDALYDVTRDGSRFLVATLHKAPQPTPLSLVVGWRPPDAP